MAAVWTAKLRKVRKNPAGYSAAEESRDTAARFGYAPNRTRPRRFAARRRGRMKKRGAFVCRDSAAGILPVVCAVVAGHLGFPQHCEAQGTAPIALPSVQFSTGMAGLASGQTARLNVVNSGATTAPPISGARVLAFLDSARKLLKPIVA